MCSRSHSEPTGELDCTPASQFPVPGPHPLCWRDLRAFEGVLWKIREPGALIASSYSSPFSGVCHVSRGAAPLLTSAYLTYLLSVLCWKWALKSLLAVSL